MNDKSEWFVALSIKEEFGDGAMVHNLNRSFMAEDEMDAINQALVAAFDDVRASGNWLSAIHVSKPRREK